MERKILHVDIDAFFASVEQIDNPKLIGKPVIVGGIGKRGVVATCSYEARKYGIHSAMSTQTARNLCPHGIFINGRHDRYREVSMRVFEVLSKVTNLIQRVSIDEAYLDITNLESPAELIAKKIKKQVNVETGLNISVGISYNKFLAKLASDWKKPDGLFEIKKEDIPEILKSLSIIRVHGLGKKTASRLNRIGIFTIGDLLNYDVDILEPILGRLWAIEIYNRIRGIDDRPVVTKEERKSYSRETTFLDDIGDKEYLIRVLKDFSVEIIDDLKALEKGVRTVTVKIKYEDFEQITRSHSIEYPTNDFNSLIDIVKLIMDNVQLVKKVRLIGVGFSNISDLNSIQLSLFDQ